MFDGLPLLVCMISYKLQISAPIQPYAGKVPQVLLLGVNVFPTVPSTTVY